MKTILVAFLDKVGKWNVLFPEMVYRKSLCLRVKKKKLEVQGPGKEGEPWVHKMVDS